MRFYVLPTNGGTYSFFWAAYERLMDFYEQLLFHARNTLLVPDILYREVTTIRKINFIYLN